VVIELDCSLVLTRGRHASIEGWKDGKWEVCDDDDEWRVMTEAESKLAACVKRNSDQARFILLNFFLFLVYCHHHFTSFPHPYIFSPLIRRARAMSLVMMVTLLAWRAHRFVSSNSETR